MNKILGFTVFLAAAQSAFTQENYGQWLYWKTVTVNTTNAGGGANVATNQSKFPVLLRLTAANFDGFAKAMANGADIRFTKSNGVTRLPHQIERWDSTGQFADIWVLADTLTGNASTTFRMYWGKAGAPDSSSGKGVFDTANGFAGAWHFHETTGNLNDATVNAIAGTSNATTPVIGVSGNGRSFNGTNSSVAFGNPTALNLAGKITLESWIFWTSSSGYRNILDHGQAVGTDPEDYLRINAGVYEAGSWNGTDHRAQFSAAGDSATWVHLAGVYDGTKWILYRNGAQLASTNDTTGAIQNFGQNWSAGATGSAASRFFSGSLDEPRISRTARSADWLKLEYASEKPNQTAVTLSATQGNAPDNLKYPINPATYTVGTAIASNVPTVTGVITGYTVAPALPNGILLNAATGVISGTPTQATPANKYVVTASNAAGSTNDTLTLSVASNVVAPDSLSYAVNPVFYTVGVSATPDIPTVKGNVTGYSVSPNLPTGLSLNPATGAIAGTPTQVTPSAPYVITAANSAGSTKDTLNLAVSPNVTAPESLSYVVNPVTYIVGLAARPDTPSVKGTVSGYTVNPDLPNGLVLDPVTGIIQGTPTLATPAANYTVTADNIVGSVSVALNLTVTSVVAMGSDPATRFPIRLAGFTGFTLRLPPGTQGIRVEILALDGRKAWDRYWAAGQWEHGMEWNGRGENGQPLSRGVYVLRVVSQYGAHAFTLLNQKISWLR